MSGTSIIAQIFVPLNVNVNARRYIDNVLRTVLLPLLRQTRTNLTMPHLILPASLSIFWEQI